MVDYCFGFGGWQCSTNIVILYAVLSVSVSCFTSLISDFSQDKETYSVVLWLLFLSHNKLSYTFQQFGVPLDIGL